MPQIFERNLYVGWADLDSKGHMKNSAYLEKAVDVRMMFFHDQGFGMREFERWRVWPKFVAKFAHPDAPLTHP